jgi:integrase
MTPELRGVLEAQRRAVTALERESKSIIPWVFTWTKKGRPLRGFTKAWRKACRDAGVPGRIPHDFRRTAVRNLERAGVPRSTAMAMVGHKTESIYRRYAIVDEAMLREGGAKLAAYSEVIGR